MSSNPAKVMSLLDLPRMFAITASGEGISSNILNAISLGLEGAQERWRDDGDDGDDILTSRPRVCH